MGENNKNIKKDSLNVKVERKLSEVENIYDATDSSLISFGERKYKMNHASRGRAIIFNHSHFKFGRERRGTETDVKNLREALLKLGFEKELIDVHENLKSTSIMNKLKKVQKEDHTDRDMLMIFVLSHGGKNDKIHAYDETYNVNDIWELFSADKCKSLAGKPKVFFFIACRGDFVDQGQDIPQTEVDAVPSTCYDTYSIPVFSDFLYVFSTFKDFYSYRHKDEGTWYIQAFCEELSKTDISKMSFLDFLTAVNGRVSLRESAAPYAITVDRHPLRVKQIPIYSSTLTKHLYLTS